MEGHQTDMRGAWRGVNNTDQLNRTPVHDSYQECTENIQNSAFQCWAGVAQNSATNFVGSFQELLRSASAGVLHYADGLQRFSASLNEVDYRGIYVNENEDCRNEEDEDGYFAVEGGGDEDGYLGGQEGGGVYSDSDLNARSDAPDASDSEIEKEHGNETCFDKPNGLDLDSDEEIETTPGCTGVHLGDCGCMTQDSGSDLGSEDSGSDESEYEDDVTVEEQEIYVDEAQQGAPYKKRKRTPKHVKRPNCRPPRILGAIERAIRSASKRESEYVFEPKVGMVFDSRQEAREFYNNYSWEVGFGIKDGACRPSGKIIAKVQVGEGEEPYRTMQEIVCQKSGVDDRTIGGSKRCRCQAKIRLLRTDDHGWYISMHESTHNHDLSKTDAEKREWNSHKKIEPHMREMIRDLRLHNVNLTKVHGIMTTKFGKNGDVPWTRRSLRRVCNEIAKEQMDDDIRKTMEIFREMHEKDPGFQFSVELDKRSRIRTLLWCSGRGREQYECFGDVITFDTTYCTNMYKMPFGLFVGVNNHFQTTIFGGVLMRRETTKSFKWVFKEFLHLMGGKPPLTILTDQCKAMTKAIRLVMPDTYHLWCKWHVMKKIRECLGPLYTKNRKFRDAFWLVVNGMLSEEEFESAWDALVRKYKLEKNAFMKRVHNCRKKWAKPWSKDKFCARMSSTQRSESANFMLKRFVPRNSSMNHFVSQYSKLLSERDREENIAEDKTKQLNMVRGSIWPFEHHAMKIYTKNVFALFRAEVAKASNFHVGEPVGNVYNVSHAYAERRAHWQRVHFKVEVFQSEGRYACECGLYEHFGILCCHSIRVMMRDNVSKIPEAHIMKRWTRNARDVIPEKLQSYQKDTDTNNSSTFRHRLMRLMTEDLITTGDMDVELFDVVMKHMKDAKKEAAELIAKREKDAEVLQDEDSSDEEINCDLQEGRGRLLGVQSDGELLSRNNCATDEGAVMQRKNKYGASGSSAVFSDNDIMSVKAPIVKKVGGRPRGRFLVGFEKTKNRSGKKGNKKNKKFDKSHCEEGLVPEEVIATELGTNEGDVDTVGAGNSKQKKKKAKRVIKCGRCGLEGHNAVQCCNLEITDDTAGQYL